MKFYDREAEIAELHRIQRRAATDHSTMTVVTGRRRVGKTSVIIKALEDGLPDIPTVYLFVARKSEAALCREFAEAASQALAAFVPAEITSFGRLFRLLLEIGQHQRFNLVIDEFQEFDLINRSVFSDMQNHWDQLRKRTNVNLIISGSVYSLMHKIFRDEKEPLFGRADNIIELKAFPLSTLKQILEDKNPAHTNDDLLALYSFSGSIAKYVEIFFDNTDMTVDSMIRFMARENSPFLDEGRNLLITELGKGYGIYFSILQAVSSGATTLNQIVNLVGDRTISGHISRLIDDYHLLARRRPIFAKPTSQTVRYCLDDNFLNFWFAYFERYRSLIEIGNFLALRQTMTQTYSVYSGLMLERYFREQLAQTMEFSTIGAWWEPRGDQHEIDIVALYLEKDRALAIEVKRQRSGFRMTKLQEKVDQLQRKAMPKYQFDLKCLTLDDM